MFHGYVISRCTSTYIFVFRIRLPKTIGSFMTARRSVSGSYFFFFFKSRHDTHARARAKNKTNSIRSPRRRRRRRISRRCAIQSAVLTVGQRFLRNTRTCPSDRFPRSGPIRLRLLRGVFLFTPPNPAAYACGSIPLVCRNKSFREFCLNARAGRGKRFLFAHRFRHFFIFHFLRLPPIAGGHRLCASRKKKKKNKNLCYY